MKIIIISWMEDGNIFSVFIGHKDSPPNHHWKMEHPQFPLVHEWKGGHWLEGGISTSSHWPRDNKLKEGSRGRFTFLLPHIDLNLDLFGSCLCARKRNYGLEKSFLQEGSVRLRRGNFKIKQFFSSLKVVFELFVLNLISFDCSDGFD